MQYLVFSIRDRVTGLYSEPFYSVNKQSALRHFNYIMSNANMVSADCELYQVGSFNNESGIFSAFEKPEFICNFEVE